MITDPKRLTDGFRGLPNGMDGSRLPPLTPTTCVWYAKNVTFRDGIGAKTRPAFHEIPPSFWRPILRGDTRTLDSLSPLVGDTIVIDGVGATTSSSRYATYVQGGKNFQGGYFYNDPRFGNPAQMILVIDGNIISLNFAEQSCFILNTTKTNSVDSSTGLTIFNLSPINASLPVYMTQAEVYLIIQNGADIPQVYDGYNLRPATAFGDGVNVIPTGLQMAYGQGRLFVVSANGTEITAGDLIYSGSSSSSTIDTITPPSFKVTAEISPVTEYPVTCSIQAGYPVSCTLAGQFIVTPSVSGTTCTLTGRNMTILPGEVFTTRSNNASDASNAAIGDFVAVTASATQITYTVPDGTVAPTGVVTAAGVYATATLTGVNLPINVGNAFVVQANNNIDAGSPVVGLFYATAATPTSISYLVPGTTTPPTGLLTVNPNDTVAILTGTNLPFNPSDIISVASSNTTDSTNNVIGTFSALTASTTQITYPVLTGTTAPAGNINVSVSTTTCTLTGVGLPVAQGENFLVSSDSVADQTNGAIGVFVATGDTGSSLTYTIPSRTTKPVGNLSLYYGLPGYVTITTTKDHGFQAQDIVTIQGTTSNAKLNGTFVVESVVDQKTFKIAVDNYAYGRGTGGTVTKANAGEISDLLNFTETTFIAEGGKLSVPADLGQIVTMNFVPLQDTATGQGDLVVLCNRGAASMAVSVERSLWSKTPGFQRVLYNSIGVVSDSTAIVNGDMFFRSLDGNGIRSYRSARAEFAGYGQVPLSAEIDPILNQDTSWLLGDVSFLYHNDRLLMTCWPTQLPPQANAGNDNAVTLSGLLPSLPTYYTGIAVLDFRAVANGHLTGSANPAFDGVWTGQNVLKLLGGNDSGVKRAFMVTFNNNGVGTQGFGIWEVLENSECDLGAQGPIPITSSITTRAYNFNEPMALKKLLRLDLWFDSIEGGPARTLNASVSYRPDDWPHWVSWLGYDQNHNPISLSKTFNTETAVQEGTFTSYPNLTDGYYPQVRLPALIPPATSTDPNANTMSQTPMPLGYDFNFQINWTGHARLGRLLVHGLEIVEAVGGASTYSSL